MIDPVPIRRALISVYDKTGLERLGLALAGAGVELISTGGSARALRTAGVAVTDVATVTGLPEILDGRVKTLHPQIHGGILGRPDHPRHAKQMAEHGIAPIELVCVNLYPFAATVASGASIAACLEQLDIGGPALIRAAAKNHASVTVLTDPAQYAAVLAEIAEHGGTSRATRRHLAAAAFARTAAYDAAVAQWFTDTVSDQADGKPSLPERLTITASLRQRLRYGENPHQAGALYAIGTPTGLAAAHQVQGKDLSYNNLADADAALACVAEFAAPAAVIVKHANPCGAATATDLLTAWELAFRCDPQSAFGGIVALNRPLTTVIAARMVDRFVEVIVAPEADEAARAVMARKPNVRLLLTGTVPDAAAPSRTLRSIAGGLLVQTRDTGSVAPDQLQVVTRRAPTEAELADLLFAWLVCKHVKSNAIVYAREGATVGIGAGQMSRVDAARLAARKAMDAGLSNDTHPGRVVASDAFFPFPDGLTAALASGATAVIQPGGSIRDAEVVAAADAAGAAMVFTGLRHFRH